jgi:hypothetical protein
MSTQILGTLLSREMVGAGQSVGLYRFQLPSIEPSEEGFIYLDMAMRAGIVRHLNILLSSLDFDLRLSSIAASHGIIFRVDGATVNFTTVWPGVAEPHVESPFHTLGTGKAMIELATNPANANVGFRHREANSRGVGRSLFFELPAAPNTSLAVSEFATVVNFDGTFYDLIVTFGSGAVIPATQTVGGGTDDFTVTDESGGEILYTYNGDTWDLSGVTTGETIVNIAGFSANNNGTYVVTAQDANVILVRSTALVAETVDAGDVTFTFYDTSGSSAGEIMDAVNAFGFGWEASIQHSSGVDGDQSEVPALSDFVGGDTRMYQEFVFGYYMALFIKNNDAVNPTGDEGTLLELMVNRLA